MVNYEHVLTSAGYPSPQEKALAALLATKNRGEKLEVLHQCGLFVGQDFKVNVIYELLTHQRPPTNLITLQEWELIHFLTPGRPRTRIKRRWNECREEIKLQLDVHKPDEYECILNSWLPLRFYKPPRVVMNELQEIINPHDAPRSSVPKVPYFA